MIPFRSHWGPRWPANELPRARRIRKRPEALHPLNPASTRRDEAAARVEAVLLSSDEPITPRRLARLADLPDTGAARRQVALLNELYRHGRSAYFVEEIAGGYQLLTAPDLRPLLDKIFDARDDLHLSGPMLETLAVVAYRQPIGRADVEAIRGVQVGEILRQLMDKGLVKFAGREDSLGRPYLYGTTKQFLQAFGLRSLNELPLVELLRRPDAPADKPTGAIASSDAANEQSETRAEPASQSIARREPAALEAEENVDAGADIEDFRDEGGLDGEDDVEE